MWAFGYYSPFLSPKEILQKIEQLQGGMSSTLSIVIFVSCLKISQMTNWAIVLFLVEVENKMWSFLPFESSNSVKYEENATHVSVCMGVCIYEFICCQTFLSFYIVPSNIIEFIHACEIIFRYTQTHTHTYAYAYAQIETKKSKVMDAKSEWAVSKHVLRSMTFSYVRSSLTLMANKFRRRIKKPEWSERSRKSECKRASKRTNEWTSEKNWKKKTELKL